MLVCGLLESWGMPPRADQLHPYNLKLGRGVSGASYPQNHAQVLVEGIQIYSNSNTGFCMPPAACSVTPALPSPSIPFTVKRENQGQPPDPAH